MSDYKMDDDFPSFKIGSEYPKKYPLDNSLDHLLSQLSKDANDSLRYDRASKILSDLPLILKPTDLGHSAGSRNYDSKSKTVKFRKCNLVGKPEDIIPAVIRACNENDNIDHVEFDECGISPPSVDWESIRERLSQFTREKASLPSPTPPPKANVIEAKWTPVQSAPSCYQPSISSAHDVGYVFGVGVTVVCLLLVAGSIFCPNVLAACARLMEGGVGWLAQFIR